MVQIVMTQTSAEIIVELVAPRLQTLADIEPDVIAQVCEREAEMTAYTWRNGQDQVFMFDETGYLFYSDMSPEIVFITRIIGGPIKFKVTEPEGGG